MKVLEIHLHDTGMKHAVDLILDTCNASSEKLNKCISATGAHGLVTAKQDKDFARLLNDFYINLPDGKPAAFIGKLKGAKSMEQCTGPDFFENVIQKRSGREIKDYFCGGKEGVAEDLKIVCEQKYNNRNIVGSFSPPFRQMNENELEKLGDEINSKNVNIVWIGLSTPKQEFFAKTLCDFINVHYIVTVGAAFDFHSGRVKKAPQFFTTVGLEWLYRLCLEPRRLWKRYSKVVPLFIYYGMIDLIFNKKQS
jgi:N-acetylglucosaminyldiphosphoundecaprenol N-acetyl-beta-D-mannosaminyltransferase